MIKYSLFEGRIHLNYKLADLGWKKEDDAIVRSYLEQGYLLGRVALEHKHIYRIYTERGELLAEVAGKMRFEASGIEDYPAVGDWVICKAREEGKAMIHALVPRKTKFSRKVAGYTTEEQIVAANVDLIFLVNALNNDYNLRRIERYLIMAWESGAQPVIILSKADLCQDINEKVAEVESIAFGVPVHVLSAYTEEGLEEVAAYLKKGTTVALLGSSGVGKSTLINRFYGQEIQRVNSVREGDDRGKHTTTHRELILLPEGAMIIDTPGMRELHLWESEEGFSESFQDIEKLAESCYFSDCQHGQEPQCAVNQALEDGTLTRERYANYLKMQRELRYIEKKANLTAKLELKKSNKKRSKSKQQEMEFRKNKRLKEE